MADPLVPLDRIAPVLAQALSDERWLDVTATLIAGGKSNLTYRLTSPAGEAVLRRPPSGRLLPRAHDMAREARIQLALAGSEVPVAPVLLVQSAELIGVPFYVMGMVEGHVLRDELPEGYARSQADRTAITDTLVGTLADIHRLDPAAVGLGDLGRPEGFMARQVERWSDQWERSRSRPVAAVDTLAARLRGIRFPPASGALVHGDFRLDNCLLDVDDPGRVNAVLDWELSTLGDPLADLGMLLLYWTEAGDPPPLLTPALTASPGFPGRSSVIERYADLTGADLTALPAYVAFAHFKFAVIAQGIAARVEAEAMAGQQFGDLAGEVERIAAAGLDHLVQHH
ncbi:phosphotransferase family protein [Blastococcus sp. TF02A-26]|uniref:phosphotransferase family protein n=1 Tax=Blastococcus sp. TF02A-26 TaxID=2250577 RepID=UPI000DE89B43|nr:phosphotransferase family protein [Blastococcus sp. TF02A-26]RBY85991.1 phosphotransferase family protein [Blastococcus sp. TF02A-26]